MIKLKHILNDILVVESLNSAKSKYLDTQKIPKYTFDSIKELDPSPTFKYLEKMIEFYLAGNVKLERLEQIIHLFDVLADRNQIQPKDISLYKSWSELENSTEAANKKYMAKQVQKLKSKDADIIVNNENLLVVVPRTHEASCAYGAGTKWCTTSPEPRMFRQYTEISQITLYYIIQKKETIDNEYYKMAVAVYPPDDDDVDAPQFECFDALDNPINFETVLDITGLDEWIFESKPKLLTTYEDFGLDPNKITKNDDGSISYWSSTGQKTTDNTVNFTARNLKIIPFHFYKVEGNFYCKDNVLTTLENSPEIVNGSFSCDSNKLENLQGAPIRVTRDFTCAYNDLRNLQHGPAEVGWKYDCSFNFLSSLDGLPNELVWLNANHNRLKSLRGLKYVSLHLNVGNNQLESLEGCPESLDGHFTCSVNSLTTLEGGPVEVGMDYICSWNKLTSLKGAPKFVGGVFDCSGNNLSEEEKEWARKNIQAKEFRF